VDNDELQKALFCHVLGYMERLWWEIKQKSRNGTGGSVLGKLTC